jgi:2-C-methyl-D-erythritol 4-phosphate cytidylyltransferase
MPESKTKMKNVAILLAGGNGNRMQKTTKDKILEKVNGKSSVQRVVESFQSARVVDGYIVVYRDKEQKEAIKNIFKNCDISLEKVLFTKGGSERYLSVFNGLTAAPKNTKYVWIHDCARSLIRPESLKLLKEPLYKEGAAVLCHQVKDSIKRVFTEENKTRLTDVKRENLLAMETPQAFAYENIMEAYKLAIESGIKATDDVGFYDQKGKNIQPVINPFPNPKLTTPEDILYFEFLLTRTTSES